MSDLRTAAQQALEAFDPKNGHPEHMWPFHVKGLQAQACKALRAALAEPEPFQPDWDRVEALQESLREHMEEVRQLRAALAAAVAEERERCATLVEDTQRQYPGDGLDGWLLAHEMRSYAAAALAEHHVTEVCFGNMVASSCGCEACDMEANGGRRTRMSVCPHCGDKRCLRAGHHDAACKAAAVAEPVALSSEHRFALREAHCIGASDAYFKAWPTHDNDAGRMLFERGFVRGFDSHGRLVDRAMEATAPAEPPQREPLTGESILDGFCKTSHMRQYVEYFSAGVRFAERAHGIKEQP